MAVPPPLPRRHGVPSGSQSRSTVPRQGCPPSCHSPSASGYVSNSTSSGGRAASPLLFSRSPRASRSEAAASLLRRSNSRAESPLPLRSCASSPMPADSEEGVSLWHTIKRQLYRSEVSHVKRLVGDPLIQQNKLLWDELASLRQILVDFQEQNDELSDSLQQKVQICGTQHRDLLRRQAQIILEDVRNQAESSGHVIEDMLPELRDPQLSNFILGIEKGSLGSCRRDQPRFTPPLTPSTRPSSSSGRSGCSSTPDPSAAVPTLPLGRQLSLEELNAVAEGIREALDAEHASLLAAIGEQMECLEAEEARRVSSVSNAGGGEPSTAQLQKLLHKLQDLVVSPTLRTLALTGPPSPTAGNPVSPGAPRAITSGGNVRRLQALIAERRQHTPPVVGALSAVPEAPASAGADICPSEGPRKTEQAALDPFFDDPFA